MRKSKIEVCELVTTVDSNKTFKENLNKQDDISVNNINKQTFKILLEDGVIVESLMTLTMYNW